MTAFVLVLVAGAWALQVAEDAAAQLPRALPPAEGLQAPVGSPSRRALLRSAALSAGAAGAALLPGEARAKDKGYLTLSEYQAIVAKEKKDEELYGLFEALRTRASQTGEFGKLASGDDIKQVSKLALGWDNDIRQNVMNKAAKQLTGDAKATGDALSNKVLADLKLLDKLAKSGNREEIDAASSALRGHVLEFVDLEPPRLAAKFGVGDI